MYVPRSKGFSNHQNKLAQHCTNSVNKNILTMRTVLTINFFFSLFLKSYHSFKKLQGFILIKKMYSQCEVPAVKKIYQLVGNYLPGTFANRGAPTKGKWRNALWCDPVSDIFPLELLAS